MKFKTTNLVAVVVAALGVSSYASAEGFYLQGDLGLANVKSKDGEKFKVRNAGRDLKKSYKESNFMPRISAGYDYGNVRVAADYSHYKTLKDGVKDGNDSLNVSVRVRGAGASVMYDFLQGSDFRPYIGARLSLNKVKVKADANVAGLKVNASDKSFKVGYGVMAGLGYKINSNMTADVGYRYNRLTSELKSHEVSAGLRYSF